MTLVPVVRAERASANGGADVLEVATDAVLLLLWVPAVMGGPENALLSGRLSAVSGDDSRLIRHLYAGALQRDPEEREEYLEGACAGRPDLRARIVALLEQHTDGSYQATTATPGEADRRRADGSAGASDLEGRKIGDYLIRREIGRGGMGVVYLADDTRLQRRVALKAINPALKESPELRGRLRNEARLAAGLSHPGIATVYALEEIDGELYIACEFVPGAPLRVLLKSGPLRIEEVVQIGLQLAKALAEAHTLGIVHRDLKPENVIRTPSGAVKILDFGLARSDDATYSARLTQTGMIMGTPAYLAPEQALGQRADFRTDLFALGLLLYELASGTNPFVARSVSATIARIIEEDPPPLSVVHPHSVPELDRVIQMCLHKNPLERYRSTQEVVADLEGLQAELARLRATPSSGTSAVAAPARLHIARSRWLIRHQAIVSLVYVAMLYPVWYARAWLPPPWNLVFLLGMLGTSATSTSLRLHLCFTAVNFPQQFAGQHTWTWRRIRVCDLVFASLQIACALVIGSNHPEFAMLFVGVSAAVIVATFVIEPATAAAAFHDRGAA